MVHLPYPEKEAAQRWATLFEYLSWRRAKALPTHCHVIVKLTHATAATAKTRQLRWQFNMHLKYEN